MMQSCPFCPKKVPTHRGLRVHIGIAHKDQAKQGNGIPPPAGDRLELLLNRAFEELSLHQKISLFADSKQS